jgi:hypothetical protein
VGNEGIPTVWSYLRKLGWPGVCEEGAAVELGGAPEMDAVVAGLDWVGLDSDMMATNVQRQESNDEAREIWTGRDSSGANEEDYEEARSACTPAQLCFSVSSVA